MSYRTAFSLEHDLTYCRGDVSSTRVSSSFTDSLHCLRSCAMWVAVCRSTFISSQSSRIVSIHRFFGLPRLLIPWTYPFKAIWGNLWLLILTTCPKNFKRLCWILWITSCFHFNLLWISELRSLSLLVTPSIFRKHAISKTFILCFDTAFIHHVSEYTSEFKTSISKTSINAPKLHISLNFFYHDTSFFECYNCYKIPRGTTLAGALDKFGIRNCRR